MGGVGKIGFLFIRTVHIRYSCLCLSCAPSSKKPHLFIYDFLACNSLRAPNALLHIADQIRLSLLLKSFRNRKSSHFFQLMKNFWSSIFRFCLKIRRLTKKLAVPLIPLCCSDYSKQQLWDLMDEGWQGRLDTRVFLGGGKDLWFCIISKQQWLIMTETSHPNHCSNSSFAYITSSPSVPYSLNNTSHSFD